MSEFNPYQPPASDVRVTENDDGNGVRLAGRGQRFAASFIDGLIGLAFSVPVMMLLGLFKYYKSQQQPPLMLVFVSAAIGFAIFSAVHYLPLSRNGQTIGKKLIGIRIADLAQGKPDVGSILIKRYLPVSFVQLIPGVGPIFSLVDILFIFRRDRRCVHDLIAGTQVVQCD